MSSSSKPERAPAASSLPVSFTIRRPTPLSRDTSTGPDSDSSASASASVSASKSSFKIPAPPQLQRFLSSEKREEDDASISIKRGSPLARGAISGSPSSTRKKERVQVDSSDDDDDDEGGDEPVTAFDRLSGALNESGFTSNGSRKRRRSQSQDGPLVIPALKNRDWRELARRRRGVGYVPGQGLNGTMTPTNTNGDTPVGQDSINTGPVLVGLQVKSKTNTSVERQEGDIEMKPEQVEQQVVNVVEEAETEDQKALRLVLAELRGSDDEGGVAIETIPLQQDGRGRGTVTEAEALKQDVEELPDSATLEDYARVPVAQFGAALLRGMGWKEPPPPSQKGQLPQPGDRDRHKEKKDKWDVKLYLPEARPALLGLGAKEQEVYDDGSDMKNKKKRRDDQMKGYLPVKQVRSGTGTPVENYHRGGSRRDVREGFGGSRSRSPDYFSKRSGNGHSSSRRYRDERDRDGDRRRD